MATTIKCPQCGNEIELDEAFRSEIEAEVLKDIQAKHKEEVHQLKQEREELIKNKEKELEKAKAEISESARKEADERIRKEYDTKIKATEEAVEEGEKQHVEAQEELLKLTKELRESKNSESKLKLEYEKKMLEEQDKLKQDAKKEAQEELNLTLAQKDKKLDDLRKQLQDAQRKAQQGSQQLQGEVQELELEEQLASEFIYDEISEVPKGITGADVIQTVKTNTGIECGTIVWESKNTKNWSPKWIPKLKDDTRKLKGDISVIVSASLPPEIDSFGMIDGVMVCGRGTSIPLAYILRDKIIAIRRSREANKDKATKAEVVYNYLISNEFKQRIEVWIDYFKSRRVELDKERGYFMKKWEKEDKNILKVIQNTAYMYGDLQGLIGAALPKVQYLEMPEDTIDDGSNQEDSDKPIDSGTAELETDEDEGTDDIPTIKTA